MSAAAAGWPAIARRIRVPLGFVLAIVYWWLAHPRWWSLITGACIVLTNYVDLGGITNSQSRVYRIRQVW